MGLALAFSIGGGCALVADLGPERIRVADVDASDVASPPVEDLDAAPEADAPNPVVINDGGIGNGVIVEVGASWNHACAVYENGVLYSWGGNHFGQLGRPPSSSDPACIERDGTIHSCQPKPMPVLAISDVAHVSAAGTDFTCAVKKDGKVYCWGRNQWGQVGVFDQDCAVPAPNGTFTVPTRCNPTPQLVLLPQKATALGISAATSCALLEGGDVYCWGFNDGARGGVALQSPSTTPFDGRRHPPTKVQFPAEAGPMVQLNASTSTNTTCARAASGQVWCWGKGHWGQAGRLPTLIGPSACDHCSHVPGAVLDTDGTVLDDAAEIGGGTATCVRRTDMTVWCFGWNAYAELGNGSVDNLRGSVANFIPEKVPLTVPVVELVSRYNQVFVTDSAGDVWAWGENRNGSLGDGTTTGADCFLNGPGCVTSPKKIPALTGMIGISAGHRAMVARKADNTVWAWGNNTQAQLGHLPKSMGDVETCADTTACNPTPSKVPLPTTQ